MCGLFARRKKQVYQIVCIGDPILREKAVEVKRFNENLHQLLDDMAETLYAADGVGLAAPQVGISKQVVVVDIGDEHGLIELINPKIIASEGVEEDVEGCLSVPGKSGIVKRAKKVTVAAQDRNGKSFTIKGEDLLARAFQHEIDHLKGVLYVDIMEREVEG
ncbi:MAG: peptide deformylase [Peptococcaceae bacterium]|jgi:peptide deformylase|nr:peptide deformylase [Peptococcaceae bacterium]